MEKNNKTTKVMLWVILIIVSLLFIKVFINPHYENKTVFVEYKFSSIISSDYNTIDFPQSGAKCICDDCAYQREYMGSLNLNGDCKKGNCVCLETKEVLAFG